MSTIDDVMRRVRKLLKLGRSDNPHEAAAAMAQAQRLLFEHGLESAAVEAEDVERVIDGGALREGSAIEKWCVRLAGVVAHQNQCRCLLARTYSGEKWVSRIDIFGHATDIQKTKYLFGYYFAEVQRLASVHGRGRDRRWKNSFRHGVVDTLFLALALVEKEVRAAAAGSKGLIRIDQRADAVENFIDEKNPKRGTYDFAARNTDAQARMQGRLAGRGITQSEARAAVGGKS